MHGEMSIVYTGLLCNRIIYIYIYIYDIRTSSSNITIFYNSISITFSYERLHIISDFRMEVGRRSRPPQSGARVVPGHHM